MNEKEKKAFIEKADQLRIEYRKLSLKIIDVRHDIEKIEYSFMQLTYNLKYIIANHRRIVSDIERYTDEVMGIKNEPIKFEPDYPDPDEEEDKDD